MTVEEAFQIPYDAGMEALQRAQPTEAVEQLEAALVWARQHDDPVRESNAVVRWQRLPGS